MLVNQPDNLNFLQNNNFEFTLRKIPTVTYFLTNFRLPQVTMNTNEVATPFISLKYPGKVKFGTFSVRFKVDEDMKNYNEIFNWITNLGFENNFEGYDEILETNHKVVSDGTLLVQNSSRQANIKIVFEDIFPILLGELMFDTAVSDINFLSCDAEFAFNKFTFTKI